MHKWQFALGLLLAICLTALTTTTSLAQATRTWVSGVGDDANPCSRTAPCKTFAGAISKTAAGGEINCIDPGGFGAVTITKSITISCEDVEAGVLVAGTSGIIINAAGAIVTLRGLDIEGRGSGLSGVRFLSGAALHVAECHIRGFRASGMGNGNGILFAPNGTSELTVIDTIISDNGAAADGAGIQIKPTGAGSANVIISGIQSINNRVGVLADGAGSTGGISVSVADSVVFGNTGGGLTAVSQGGASTRMMISRTISTSNGNGINSNGSAAILRIGNSVVTNNTTGVLIQNGGTMSSFGTNQIEDNAGPGQTIPIIPQK